MVTYDVTEIFTGNIVLSDKTYEECVEWIETHGDLLNYTITIH